MSLIWGDYDRRTTGPGSNQYLTTNNAARLRVNQVQYSFLCYPDGGVVDDILVYRLQEKVFMLVVNASNADKDLEWIKEHSTSFPGTQVEDQSDNLGLLALQGPLAARILSFLTTYDLASIKYYWSVADVGGRHKAFFIRLHRRGWF